MGGQERVEVVIDFKTVGLDQIAAQARRVLQQIANLPTGAGQGQYSMRELERLQSQTQLAARRRIEELSRPGVASPASIQAASQAKAQLSGYGKDLDVNRLIAEQNRVSEERRRAIEAERAQQVEARRNAALRAKWGTDSTGTAVGLEGQLRADKSRAKRTELLAGDSEGAEAYQATRARLIRAQANLTAAVQQELASTQELAQAKAREARARNQIRAQLASLRSRPEDVAAEADARLAERRLARLQKSAEITGTSPDDLRQQANVQFLERRQRAQLAALESQKLSGFGGASVLQSEGKTAALKARQAAIVESTTQQQLSEDSAYIKATAQAKVARERQANRIALSAAGESFEGLNDDQLGARAAVVQRMQADLRAAAAANQMVGADKGAIQASVQRRNAEARLRAAETQLEQAYIRSALAQGQLGGTFFQRLQSRFSPTPRAPQEFQRGPQYFGQKALQTAGYGVAATAFYGAISGVTNLIAEASKLQEIFVQIDNQLVSLGKGSQTGEVKKQVLDIAAATGIASDEVGKVAFQFIGAFGGDVQKALTETDSAMKLVQVTGLELGEVVDSLTAITKTFGVTIEEIGDSTLGLQERFGVLSAEIVTFVGDTAAVAEEAGISFKDLAAIGAIAQQQSGKSGAVLAEQFNRIVPALTDSRSELLSLYDTLAQGDQKFKGGYQNLLKAFSSGQTGDVIKQLATDFDDLSDSQRAAIVRQVGGRREAQTLIAVLRDSGKLLGEFQRNESDATADAGKLDSKFQDIRETLASTGERLGEALKQIGEALLASGVGDLLTTLGNALTTLLGAGRGVFEVFSGINSALGGFPGEAVKFIAMAALLYKVLQQLESVRKLRAASAVQDTVLSTAQASAHTQVATAATAEAAAVERSVVADQASVASSAQAAAASRAQSAAGYAATPSGLLVPGQTGPAGPAQQGSRFAQYIPFGTANPNSFRNMYSAARGGGATRRGALGAGFGTGGDGKGLAVAAIATAGAVEVLSAYNEQNTKVEEAAQFLKDRLKEADRKQLEEIANSHVDWFDALSMRVFGEELHTELAQEEIRIRDSSAGVQNIDALVQGGWDDDFVQRLSDENIESLRQRIQDARTTTYGDQKADPLAAKARELGIAVDERDGLFGESRTRIDRDALQQALPKLRDQAKGGDEGAGQLVEEIDAFLAGQDDLKDIRKIVSELANNNKIGEAIEAAGGLAGYMSLQLETTKTLADTGKISQFDYEAKLQQEITTLKDYLSRAPTDAAGYDADLAELAKFEQEARTRTLERIQRQVDFSQKLSELEGGGARESFDFTLAAIERPDLGLDQKLALLPDALEGLQAKFEEDLSKIEDPVARANAALAGVEVPPELQRLIAAQQILDTESLNGVLNDVAEISGGNTTFQDVIGEAATLVTTTDLSLKDAVLKIIDDRIAALKQARALSGLNGGSAEATSKAIAELEAARDLLEGTDVQDVNDVERITGQTAATEKELAEAWQDRARADLELAAAYAEGNPVAEAQVEIQAALLDLNIALSKGDYAGAQSARASLVRAQRQAAQAAMDITRANIELLKVAADGDPIREAQLDIQLAYLELTEARQSGDQAGAARAQAAILSAQQQARDAADEVTRSQIELREALSGNPVEQAQLQLQLADFDFATARGQAERNRAAASQAQARQQIQEALIDVQRAQLELTQAMVSGDPVALARIALQSADLEAAQVKAGDEAGRLRALAQRVQAEQQMKEAVAGIARAQIDLLQAMASYAGDTVRVAELALQAAQEELRRLQESGGGQESLARAQAEIIRQQGALRDARLQDQLGDIDFFMQIGDITTAQAIEMLEALAQIPDLTEDQVRQIRLKIKSLQEALSQDFQFNLPTFLGIPTAYEARRLTQSSQQSIGYQDNRTNVTVIVPDAGDPEATALAVAAVFADTTNPTNTTAGNRMY